MDKRAAVFGRVEEAHSMLLHGYSCTAAVAYFAQSNGVMHLIGLFNRPMP
ncbi:hypothetical protein [Prochlorococcus marinus]|nr:hypothetical protein [Prochlorococcus marinus]